MTRFKTTTLVPANLNQFFVGFDRFFDDAFSYQSNASNYPPHSIYALNQDKTEHCIEIAVAGFKKSELSIHLSPDNTLSIKGQKKKKFDGDDGINYAYRGLSGRSFEKKFTLNRDLEINRSTCEDGILKIFVKDIPHKDDTKIEIE